MIGTENFDLQCTLWHIGVKNSLCIKSTVVIAHTCMVTPNNQMGAAGVLAGAAVRITTCMGTAAVLGTDHRVGPVKRAKSRCPQL